MSGETALTILDDQSNARVANVKSIAGRIAKTAEGLSVREFLDGAALSAGTLIKAFYHGPGRSIAVDRFIEALRRAVQ
ncbi:hypothetical protein [Bradyrhizobium sp. ORS 86]|uniref:hypothetical protein n=1 Tax=Bradyrhizobium sp. ORS 86 TaxID=1685970 RepID=UPI003890BABF